MSKHTPEPWGSPTPGKHIIERAVETQVIGKTRVPDQHWGRDGHLLGELFSKADRDRAVACVNALAGIPDPAAYIASLMSIRVTIDTPNEVCDGKVTDTIGNLIKLYGQECLDWIVEATPESEVKRG